MAISDTPPPLLPNPGDSVFRSVPKVGASGPSLGYTLRYINSRLDTTAFSEEAVAINGTAINCVWRDTSGQFDETQTWGGLGLEVDTPYSRVAESVDVRDFNESPQLQGGFVEILTPAGGYVDQHRSYFWSDGTPANFPGKEYHGNQLEIHLHPALSKAQAQAVDNAFKYLIVLIRTRNNITMVRPNPPAQILDWISNHLEFVYERFTDLYGNKVGFSANCSMTWAGDWITLSERTNTAIIRKVNNSPPSYLTQPETDIDRYSFSLANIQSNNISVQGSCLRLPMSYPVSGAHWDSLSREWTHSSDTRGVDIYFKTNAMAQKQAEAWREACNHLLLWVAPHSLK